MIYIANISYGKDSLAMLEIIKQNELPLDRIVHAEIMATKTIPADLPEMMEFKDKADKIILARYGIKVERIFAPKSYEEYFYMINNGKKSKNAGKIYGFPFQRGNWCNSRLKMSVLNKFDKKDITQYIGIAVEEVNRYGILNERKRSPLIEYGITEKYCYDWCKENDLLSPIYKDSFRGGCWFCHNQRLQELKNIRKNYPEYWELMLKWDNDSPTTFKSNGQTVKGLDKRFELEDRQIRLSELHQPFKESLQLD